MKAEKTKEQLEYEMRSIRSQLSKIDRQQWIAEHAQYVGTYWKYRNCYSCPEKRSDYWFCYRKLERINAAGQHFQAFTFQTDKDGRMRIEPNEFCSGHEGWVPCTRKEFLAAWKKLTARISKVQP